MRIIIAPNSFKGSLRAGEAADAIAQGLQRVSTDLDLRCFPLADGGEGTVEAVLSARRGALRTLKVHDPLRNPIQAGYALLADGRALIEMATAAGLTLVPEAQRDPLRASSLGVGELILDALDQGCREIIIGLGGSATNDGGTGLLTALGFRFLDDAGQPLTPGGGALTHLARIDLSGADPRLANTRFIAATDVDNPLLGPRGATQVFGPQKGASPEMLAVLEAGMRNYAERIAETLKLRVHDLPGAGAAGGCGAALMAFLQARRCSGAALVIEAQGIRRALQDADLVITGEGRVDAQTTFGKAPYRLARLAREQKMPVILLAGSIAPEARSLLQEGLVQGLIGITPADMPLTTAMLQAPELLADGAERALRGFLAGLNP